MRTSTAATIATLLSLNFTVSDAQVVDTGHTLLKTCKTESPAYGYCIGYIRGIVARGSLDRVYYCVPPGDKDDLMAAAVISYLESDPTQHHYPAVMLVLNALNKSFSCLKATP